MSVAYTPMKGDLLRGGFDFREAGDDMRIALLMTNTTADTEEDTEFVAGFTTLDEYDGANYERKALANQTVTTNTTDDRGEFSADPVTWTELGAGTRSAAGILLFKFITNDAASPVVAFLDGADFPINGNGGDLTYTPAAGGILQVTSAA